MLLLGKERFAGVDIRVRVKGGGHVAQIYGKMSALPRFVNDQTVVLLLSCKKFCPLQYEI